MIKQKTIRALVSKDGKLSTPDMMDLLAEIAKHAGKEVEIPVKKRRRTTKQNSTIHWAMNILSEGLTERGYSITMADLKYELKQKGFFGWVEYETPNEGTKRRPKDTHEQTTDEQAESFERIQLAATKYDIIIPNPDPNR